LRDQIDVLRICAKFNREILTINETPASQFVEKNYVYRVIARRRQQATETINPPRLLRQRGERPCDARAQKRDELAPPHIVSSPPAETLVAPSKAIIVSNAGRPRVRRIAANITKLPELTTPAHVIFSIIDCAAAVLVLSLGGSNEKA
jgi:hypothetical protein